MTLVPRDFHSHFAEIDGLSVPASFDISAGEERDARKREDDRPIYADPAKLAEMRAFFDNLESTKPQNGVQLGEVVQPVVEPELRRDRTARIPYTFSAISGLSNVARRRKGQ